jgi:hypothetical protein
LNIKYPSSFNLLFVPLKSNFNLPFFSLVIFEIYILAFSFPVLSKIVCFSPKSLNIKPVNPKEQVYINPLLFS